MHPLTFSFTETSTAERVQLFPTRVMDIPKSSWQEFAHYTAQEKSLRPSTADTLAERWQQGRAAVAIQDRLIISYVSLVPVFYPNTRIDLGAELGIEPERLPSIDIDGSSTGWTHPDWRRRGINMQLRHKLLERFNQPNRFYVGVTVGFGASPLLDKLGWRIVAWRDIAYTSSLAGIAIAGFEDAVGSGWHVPPGMVKYQGEHVSPYQDTDHEWKRFCHLWVSNPSLAKKMDRQLSTLLNDALDRWQQAIINVFSVQPGSPWTLHLFQE